MIGHGELWPQRDRACTHRGYSRIHVRTRTNTPRSAVWNQTIRPPTHHNVLMRQAPARHSTLDSPETYCDVVSFSRHHLLYV
jgi:hypothetical protein